MSATKSAMVKSTSCPTAEIIGMAEACIARATVSELKAARSSMEPPPRPADYDVEPARLVEVCNGPGNLMRGCIALHGCGRDYYMHARRASL